MKKVLLFGAGKSATVLIDYLLDEAKSQNWKVTVVDADEQLAREKIGNSQYGEAVSFDIQQSTERQKQIESANIVISLLPPSLHLLVAQDCLSLGRNLLTASYVDDSMRKFNDELENRGLLFLCEMGLDPGIDHMSAKKIIDSIHEKGGQITSFISHCGGLVSPESDNNPWHYKISWNPRNVVNAGKAGAVFKKNGEIQNVAYEQLFAQKNFVQIPGADLLCWYPNRDSLSYIPVYGLEQTQTFIRTTLRHPDFIYGWNNLIELNLTSESDLYDTAQLSISKFFRLHFDKKDFNGWLENKLKKQVGETKNLLEELVNLTGIEQRQKDSTKSDELLIVDGDGDLKEIDIDEMKINTASDLAGRMHDASLTLKQLFFLGMEDEQTIIDRGRCSAADVLQFILEHKLALQSWDKDRVVMLHEIEHEVNNRRYKSTSTLVLDGTDSQRTAMAKTVGLPLGIAAKLILNGTIKEKGLRIPVDKEIYQPVLTELALAGIYFDEKTEFLS